MKIGVFDSGIGGLTVLKRLIADFPLNEYIYFGDTLNLPYGTKSLEELESFADKIIKFLITEKVDIIVIACGTISSNLYDKIKDKYGIKIIDVLTPTVKYIKENNLGSVGILGTPMTIKSKAFDKYVLNSVSCPLFVPLIESGKINSKECEEAIKGYLKELGDCDNIILGCTHYPLLIPILAKYTKANLIDMGMCVSRCLNIKNGEVQQVRLYFSKVNDVLKNNVKSILGDKYEIKEKVL